MSTQEYVQSEQQWVQVGDQLVLMRPTMNLRWYREGNCVPQLQQWFEAKSERDGVVYGKGEWKPVPESCTR